MPVTIEPALSSAYPLWCAFDVSHSEPGILHFKTIDAFNNPLGHVWVWIGQPDGTAEGMYTDRSGMADDRMLPGVSYFAYIQDEDAADPLAHTETVRGLEADYGFTVTFQRLVMPIETVSDAVRLAAQQVKWMPVNNDGALWKFAKAHNLQDQQTDELTMEWEGQEYVLQVFNLGIVYAPIGQWNEIKVILK